MDTLTWNDLDLQPHHVDVLTDRGITPDIAHAHGYRSSHGEMDLRRLGYKGDKAKVSGALVIPLHDAEGDVNGYQIRPDDEIAGDRPGTVLKYLSPPGQMNVVDVPVSIGARGTNQVCDPDTPLVVTEGPLKAAAASARGIPCVSIQGVSSYVGTSSQGGKGVYLSDWRQFARNRLWIIGYDSDAMQKSEVLRETHRLGEYLSRKQGATVTYLLLPGGDDKVGLDDWLVRNPAAGMSDLLSLCAEELPDPDAVDETDPNAVPATDLDVADAYVQRYGDRVRYLTDLGRWVGFAAGRWDMSGGDSVARADAQDLFRTITCYKVVSDGQGGSRKVSAGEWLYQSARIDNTLAQVRSNRRMQARADDMNQSPMLLNVANGTVDLVTGMLHPHDPRDLLTQMTEVEYDTDATAPEFERFIRQVLPDGDVRGFVQRLFGMSLLGEVRDHVFTVFTGTGRNGKGVLLRIAQSVFGDYSTGIHKDLLVKTNFEGHPTHLASLYGRRLAVAQELERGAKWDVSRVKELSGGDAITARWMRGNEFTFTPSHTIIMSSNHRPAVGEGERAFWLRYREVPFTVSFDGREDTTLADRIISSELPGVLQWMLRGLRDYLDHGLGSPAAVTLASREAQEESDPLLRFLHDGYVVTGEQEDRVPTRDVYDAWTHWATTEGDHIKVGAYSRFGRTLKASTPAVDVKPGNFGDLRNVSIVHGMHERSNEVTPVTENPVSAGVEAGVEHLPAGVESGSTQASDQHVYKKAGVAGVKPEIELQWNRDFESMELNYSERDKGDSTPATPATPADTSPTDPVSVTHGEESSVSTGLLADGSVSPDFTIRQGQEVGTEVVSYSEWVRRMRLAGKWVDPSPGIEWEEGVSDAA